MAEFNNRPAGPTCEDAAAALRLANELARPDGWQGPTAAERWETRPPISDQQRRAFIQSVESNRSVVIGTSSPAPYWNIISKRPWIGAPCVTPWSRTTC